MGPESELDSQLFEEFAQRIESREWLADPDKTTINYFGKVFQTELFHLKNARGTAEAGAGSSAGSPKNPPDRESPSKIIYDGEYVEVNRTMMSILSLKWILKGDYDSFISGQELLESDKLTIATFNQLCKYFEEVLEIWTHSVFDLIVILVVSDLGKDPAVRETLEWNGIQLSESANHDLISYLGAKNALFPVFKQVPTDRKSDILLGLEFAAKSNIPQALQTEGPPGSLSEVGILRGEPRARDLKFMEIILDIAGAAGHTDTRGARAMIQSVAQIYMAFSKNFPGLCEDQISKDACYASILRHRIDMIGEKTSSKLAELDHSPKWACSRLLCIGRVTNDTRGTMFVDEFLALDPQIQEDLANGLNVKGTDDGMAIVPYYAPALFVASLKRYDTPDNLPDRIASLFRYLARVFQGTKPEPGRKGCIVELDLHIAVQKVDSDEFRNNPKMLDRVAIPKVPKV